MVVDQPLNLSWGESRHAKHWKNRAESWSYLLERLQQPTVTQETQAEYKKLSKTKRDEIKDVGGFVGGFLKQGRRKNGYVQNRSLITLDADFAYKDMWETVKLLADYAIAVYTTHSHTPAKPRYRFLIPLSRPVTADEYEPIARKVADTYGMDYFDDTTYQATRLMYLPSHSRDGEYLFDFVDLPWLDPDEVLAQYEDWRDSSYWPESSRSKGVRKRQAEKAGDPLDKQGVIGAFCRTYDIHSAIEEFLGDVYAPTDKPDRYTYLEGSTSAGLVIYDDKFAYSHHGTDPVGDTLVNAFDLVRIHKFGDLDEDVKPHTNVTKYPSYSAMQDFALGLPKVKKTVVQERVDSAKSDFDEWEDTESGGADDSWMEDLEVSKQGLVLSSAQNIDLILQNDPNLKGKIKFDVFSGRSVLAGNLPWRQTKRDSYWKDADDAGLRNYLESTYGITNRSKIDDSLALEVERQSFHPVRDYLRSLKWDHTERLEELFMTYLGAEDNDYNRMVTRKWMVAAVARIMRPGIKFDNMLVVSGPQGIGKTLLGDRLAGQWFSSDLKDMKSKDSLEALRGVWIMEMGELTAMRKSDIEEVKNFISKREDNYREAYGRRKEYFPRQVVFYGTTNEFEFLKDPTGNRRFWPVTVGKEDIKTHVWEMTEEDRDQIWAEAKYLFDKGESIYLTDREEEAAKEVQNYHTGQSTLKGEIESFLDIPITEDWYERTKGERLSYIKAAYDDVAELGNVARPHISVVEVWNELYGQETNKMSYSMKYEIKRVLEHLEGWQKVQNGSNGQVSCGEDYGRQVSYERLNDPK
nr:virulence-associated E family protein [Aerococcus urinae]